MDAYRDGAWFGQVRRTRRTDPVYKPALLLVVLDLIEQGAAPEAVPVGEVATRFDELMALTGLERERHRAVEPVHHLSTASKTAEPFWTLVKDGLPVLQGSKAKSTRRLLQSVDVLEMDPVLADELRQPEGIDMARAAIYQLLEDDGRSDCQALLRVHDRDHLAVRDHVVGLITSETAPFVLDDPNARTRRTVREQIARDRTLRLAVLPAYDFACALCSTRIIWNDLKEVEAAHIKPRSARGADDTRNALSLCQTHHWAFDLGLWSLRDDLTVIVGKPVHPRGDDLRALRGFHEARLREPLRESARPHPDALRWHREHRFERVA